MTPRIFPSHLARLLAVVLVSSGTSLFGADGFHPLFDGTFTGWRHWLGKPHPSLTIEGLARDETGKYLDWIGWDRDPLDVFQIVSVDGAPALYLSGQIFGVLMTTETFSNYHLRLQFKWGEKRWPPRATVVRDSGLLYHTYRDPGSTGGTWPPSVEFQIQEGDTGDLWTIHSEITVRARATTDANQKTLYRYDPAAEPVVFTLQAPFNRCIKGADFEKPTGEWNTLELVCLGEEAIYVVNGHVVMRLRTPRQRTDEGWAPLTAGALGLQSEGAEIFYRGIEIAPITAIPPAFLEH